MSKDIKFPVVNNAPTTPNPKVCTACGNPMHVDGDVWIMCGAGGDFNDRNAQGFLLLDIHDHGCGGGSIDIVKDGTRGQADIGFCSTDCLRTFFNVCVDELEAKKQVKDSK